MSAEERLSVTTSSTTEELNKNEGGPQWGASAPEWKAHREQGRYFFGGGGSAAAAFAN